MRSIAPDLDMGSNRTATGSTRAVVGVAFVLLVLVAALSGCSSTGRPVGSGSGGSPSPPVLLVVGIDGFRWDYLDRAPADNLARLAAEGVRAERLIPSFPSKTFPNHYTMVTGLRPGRHGIVANSMYDPVFDAEFSLGNRAAVGDGRWWGGEPIWVTAERQGQRTAAFFWPGSEAEIGGIRPTFWQTYDHDLPHDARIDQVLEWLALPPAERPSFITLYFSDVDSAGHDHGPEPGRELDAAIARVDASIGRLLAGIEALGAHSAEASDVNLVLVSDHGMAATSSDRVILLDDYIDLEAVRIIDWSPVAAILPPDDAVDRVYEQLAGAHPHLSVYRRGDLPTRWAYDHRRVAPIVAVADEGWTITERARYERCPECFDGGDHGYAPEVEAMGGLFVAWGPAFVRGKRIAAVDNIDLYELFCRVLGLEAAPNQGAPDALAHTLLDAP